METSAGEILPNAIRKYFRWRRMPGFGESLEVVKEETSEDAEGVRWKVSAS
jgi:hypothetical protein